MAIERISGLSPIDRVYVEASNARVRELETTRLMGNPPDYMFDYDPKTITEIYESIKRGSIKKGIDVRV